MIETKRSKKNTQKSRGDQIKGILNFICVEGDEMGRILVSTVDNRAKEIFGEFFKAKAGQKKHIVIHSLVMSTDILFVNVSRKGNY